MESTGIFNSGSADMSRAIEKAGCRIAYSNISVPRFEDFNDVGDFVRQFEITTNQLDEETRCDLLAKAFVPGRGKNWYESDLEPLLAAKKDWNTARKLIIERFSDAQDEINYFSKLRNASYEPNSGKKLLDFVEEIVCLYKKSYGFTDGDLNCVKFIKGSIPQETRAKLNICPSFKGARTIKELKDCVKEYDATIGADNSTQVSSKVTEMFSKLCSKIESIEKDNSETKKAIKAAFVAKENDLFTNASKLIEEKLAGFWDRFENPPGTQPALEKSDKPNLANRSSSPIRNYRVSRNSDHNNNRRSRSPSKSPVRQSYAKEEDRTSSKSDLPEYMAFDNKSYYNKFGRPNKTCEHCKAWHWSRHCPLNHLN